MLDSLSRIAALGLLVALGAACDDSPSEPTGGNAVTVRFTAATGASASSRGPQLVPASLTIEGTNGSLLIDEISMIVAEFELDRDDDIVDCDAAADEDACEEFEGPPAFIELPLETGAVTVANAAIPDGTYDEFEFEVEDIDIDEDDEDAALIAAVAAEALAAYPEWPEEATMVVRGTFTPTGGAPVAFTAFFDAEIKVELDLVPPLTIAGGAGDGTLTVQLVPQEWFRNGDGTVVDLSEWDFAATGEAADFELDIESNFEDGVEVDLDGFDD